MNRFELGDQDAWVWMLSVVALLFGFVALGLWRKARLEALEQRGPLPGLFDSTTPSYFVLRASLVLLSVGLLCFALMRPQYGARTTEFKNMGIDIAVVIDGSKSMKVNDIVPDRFESSKLEIRRLLGKVAGGRVALVPFAGVAFAQTQLTSDFDVVETYLEDLRIEDMPRGGTALGRAINEAIRVLLPLGELETVDVASAQDGAAPAAKPKMKGEDEREVEAFEGSKHKAIIIFTDGESHESDPLEAAELARKFDITIFTVGVGTTQGRPVPILNERGERVGNLKGPDGKTPLFSSLNVDLLKQIAAKTGGEYFPLTASGLGDGLLKAVDKLEKAEYEARTRKAANDRYQLAVIPAVVLLLIEAWLSERRRRRRRRRV